MKNILRALREVIKEPQIVYAHCDIPCGIYSPNPSALAAETVERMVSLLHEMQHPTDAASKEVLLSYHNTLTRLVKVKEEHAELCKREILVLWTDFFKPEHLAQFPDLHEKVWKAAKLCSKNKQEVSTASAQELRKAVAEIGDIFLQVKGLKK